MTGELVHLSPSVGLGPVAEELNTNVPFIVRILRTIVWFGLAQSVICFLQQEEARVAAARTRRPR